LSSGKGRGTEEKTSAVRKQQGHLGMKKKRRKHLIIGKKRNGYPRIEKSRRVVYNRGYRGVPLRSREKRLKGGESPEWV